MIGLSRPPACSKQRHLCTVCLLLVDEYEVVQRMCNAEAAGQDSHHCCLGRQVLLCRHQQGHGDRGRCCREGRSRDPGPACCWERGFVRAAAMCAEATSTRLGLADTTDCASLQRGALEWSRYHVALPWARKQSNLRLILGLLGQCKLACAHLSGIFPGLEASSTSSEEGSGRPGGWRRGALRSSNCRHRAGISVRPPVMSMIMVPMCRKASV